MAIPAQLDAVEPIVEQTSLTDRVHASLREAILEGRLSPGTHLSVPELSRRLAVSRSPVRDAIFRLQSDGLVHVIPNRGALVAHADADGLRELFDLREALEGMAARLAATHVGEIERRQLEEQCARHRAAAANNDRTEHVRHDLEFHSLVRKGSRNLRLVSALDRLEAQIELAIHTTAARPGSVEQALEEHAAILDALIAGDPDSAEHASRSHIRRVRTTLLEAVQAR